MKKSKIIAIIVIIIIVIAVIAGYLYFNEKEQANQELENKIDTAARDYFDKYVSTNDSRSVYEVTLEMLEEANQNGEEYDLSGLDNCQKQETLVKITVNYSNGQPKKTEVELSCK